jgi:hypothetical protein
MALVNPFVTTANCETDKRVVATTNDETRQPRSADHAHGQRYERQQRENHRDATRYSACYARVRSPPAGTRASACLPVRAAVRQRHRLVLTPSEVLPDRVLERLPTRCSDAPVDHRSARLAERGLCDLPSSSRPLTSSRLSARPGSVIIRRARKRPARVRLGADVRLMGIPSTHRALRRVERHGHATSPTGCLAELFVAMPFEQLHMRVTSLVAGRSPRAPRARDR